MTDKPSALQLGTQQGEVQWEVVGAGVSLCVGDVDRQAAAQEASTCRRTIHVGIVALKLQATGREPPQVRGRCSRIVDLGVVVTEIIDED